MVSATDIAPELLALLRCPATHQPLALAASAVCANLESMRLRGTLRDLSGKPVGAEIHAGLLRTDGAIFYPIRDGIPVLIVEDSISLPT